MARLVLIDDDKAFRSDLADTLAEWGHSVRQAADITDGEDAIEYFRPDIVLCDISMPSGSGFALFERMGGKAVRYPGMSFIFISAISSPHAVSYGLSGGAEDFITKPIHYGRLRATIETSLKKKDKAWGPKLLKLFAT